MADLAEPDHLETAEGEHGAEPVLLRSDAEGVAGLALLGRTPASALARAARSPAARLDQIQARSPSAWS